MSENAPGYGPAINGKLKSDRYRDRLWRAHTASRHAMKPFLRQRRAIFEHMAGPNYGQAPTRGRKLVNKVNQGINLYSRLLAARNPAVRVRSELPEFKPLAALFTIVMNKSLREINFQRTIQEMTMDATALYGLAKICQTDSTLVLEHEGESAPLSKLSVSRVSPDNATWDMAARSRDALQFIGDLVEADLDKLLEDGRYENADGLSATGSRAPGGQWGEQAGSLSRPTDLFSQSLYDRVKLWTIYIPSDDVVVTLPEHGGDILRIAEWDGPESGPYEFLSFLDIPDNPMPSAPANQWVEAASLIETLSDKMGKQAQRHKSNPVGYTSARKDIEAAKTAVDGEWLAMEAPGQIQTIVTGGVDQLNFGYLHWLVATLNVQMGNIDLLAGSAPQSETATQDQMLMRQANILVDDMRQQVVNASQRIIEKAAHYKYHDELDAPELMLSVPGLPVEIVRRFTADIRTAEWRQLGLEIQPFSMLPKTPAQELAEIREFLVEVLGPLAPLAAEQGKTIPLESLVAIWADRTGVPDIEMLLKDAPELEKMREDGVFEMPQRSRREYIRRGEGGKRSQNESQDILLNIAQSPDGRGRQGQN